MVLTAAQVVAFFYGLNQIDMPHETKVHSQYKGMTDPDNLMEFAEEAITAISHN